MAYELIASGAPLARGAKAPFPFVRTTGQQAMAMLAELRAAYPDRSPVIWGDAEDAGRLFELFGETTRETIDACLARAFAASATELIEQSAAAQRVRVAAFFAQQGLDYQEALADDDADRQQAEADAIRDTEAGAIPVVLPREPASLRDFAGAYLPELLIGLVPASQSFEVPAHLRFGNWNSCPDPAIHTALGREWAERHGARLIVNRADVIEYEIERPVATLAEARELARLQYRYCGDIVDQGGGTVEELARNLIGARYWFFWWD